MPDERGDRAPAPPRDEGWCRSPRVFAKPAEGSPAGRRRQNTGRAVRDVRREARHVTFMSPDMGTSVPVGGYYGQRN